MMILLVLVEWSLFRRSSHQGLNTYLKLIGVFFGRVGGGGFFLVITDYLYTDLYNMIYRQ